MEPMPHGGVWKHGEHERPEPRQPPVPLSPAEIDQSARLAVVVAAVSLALFVVTMFLLSTTVYDGGEVCGSPLGGVGVRTSACDDRVLVRWRWAMVLGGASLGAAVLAFRLRWGPGWLARRRTDDR